MPASKLGPGRLTLGATGSASEWGGHVTEMEVKPESKADDNLVFLDWSEKAGDTVDSWSITGKVGQTWDKDSLIKWTWDHHGQELPVTFVPDRAGALQLTGVVKVTRIGFGGEVKKANVSDFEFTGIGEPKLTDDHVADVG